MLFLWSGLGHVLCWGSVYYWRRAAGRVSPRRARYFSCAAKKSTQKKAAPTDCVPSLRYGQPVVLGYGLHRETHYAPEALRSNRRGESVHDAVALCGATAQPIPCAPRRIQKGSEQTQAIATLGQFGRPSVAMACRVLAVGVFAFPLLQTPRHRLPFAKRRVASSRGAFALVTFIWRQMKVTAPPGAHPGQQPYASSKNAN